MSSELANFFYVWLHTALKNEYEEFKPDLSPTANEIVINEQEGKDQESFIDGIHSVFEECCRVLKWDGELIFTYHHNEPKAWAAILEALLKAGFYVSAMYPIAGDPSFNPHIKNKSSTQWDVIIACRKRREEKQITFEIYERELYFGAKSIIEDLIRKKTTLSKGDIMMIAFGKCLEIYSKYYPNITKNGQIVSIESATNKVADIIEELYEPEQVPSDLDLTTRTFVLNMFEAPGISYDELNKRLRQTGMDIADLEAEKLVVGLKNSKGPAEPSSRKSFIEKKIRRGEPLLDIDKAQYLYVLYTSDQNVLNRLLEWKSPSFDKLLEILAEKTGDSRYSDLGQINLSIFED